VIEFIALLLFIGLICAISTVAEICEEHLKDWWEGKLK
jgi:hypothetical protein